MSDKDLHELAGDKNITAPFGNKRHVFSLLLIDIYLRNLQKQIGGQRANENKAEKQSLCLLTYNIQLQGQLRKPPSVFILL